MSLPNTTRSLRRAARVPSDVKTILQRRPRVNRGFAGSDDLVRVSRFPGTTLAPGFGQESIIIVR